jgi:hypothetical protein
MFSLAILKDGDIAVPWIALNYLKYPGHGIDWPFKYLRE